METTFNDFEAPLTVGTQKTQSYQKNALSAFVFINCNSPDSNSALQEIKQVEGVDEVYQSRGIYDLVAKISAQSHEEMRERVLKEIKNVADVKSTLTMMVVDSK
jgi:DNA-binding Lrp family transcriptional regulator